MAFIKTTKFQIRLTILLLATLALAVSQIVLSIYSAISSSSLTKASSSSTVSARYNHAPPLPPGVLNYQNYAEQYRINNFKLDGSDKSSHLNYKQLPPNHHNLHLGRAMGSRASPEQQQQQLLLQQQQQPAALPSPPISLTIAVTTTPDRLATQAAAIARTWALVVAPSASSSPLLPSGSLLRVEYFVAMTNVTTTTTGRMESIERAKWYGVSHHVHILPAVHPYQHSPLQNRHLRHSRHQNQSLDSPTNEDEYADPTLSISFYQAMLESLASRRPSSGNHQREDVVENKDGTDTDAATVMTATDWTYIVNDQVYIHWGSFLAFLATKQLEHNPQTESLYLGRPVHRHEQVNNHSEDKRDQKYARHCWHPAGYLLSRPAVLEMSQAIKQCSSYYGNNPGKNVDAEVSSSFPDFWAHCMETYYNRTTREAVPVPKCMQDSNFLAHQYHREYEVQFKVATKYSNHIDPNDIKRSHAQLSQQAIMATTSHAGRFITTHVQTPTIMDLLHQEHFVSAYNNDNNNHRYRTSDPPLLLPPWRIPDLPRVHVFDDMKAHDQVYGDVDFYNDTLLTTLLHNHFFSYNRNSNDNGAFEVKRCMTCDNHENVWFTAVTASQLPDSSTKRIKGKTATDPVVTNLPTVSVWGQAHRRGFPIRHAMPSDHSFEQVDFLVPFFGATKDKLTYLVDALIDTVERVNVARPETEQLVVRLLLTMCSENDQWLIDTDKNSLARTLKDNAAEANIEIVVVPYLTKETVNRAKAVNALLRSACHEPDCIVAIVDVDMRIDPSFIYHSMAFVYPSVTAYVPIDYTQNNPKSIKLVQDLTNRDVMMWHLHRWHNVDYQGHWRWYAYGQIAISGPDAAAYRMQEDFVGWGGEDIAYYRLLASHLNIVRMREPGLFHRWHVKKCEIGSFVLKSQYPACQSSVDRVEGSVLGVYLKKQAEKQAKDSKKEKAKQAARSKKKDQDHQAEVNKQAGANATQAEVQSKVN